MTKDIFSDGIMNMGFGQGALRIDLGRLGDSPQKGEKPELEFVQRIVMTPDGFAQTVAAMNAMAKQLAEAGILKVRDDADAKAPHPKVESVNFK